MPFKLKVAILIIGVALLAIALFLPGDPGVFIAYWLAALVVLVFGVRVSGSVLGKERDEPGTSRGVRDRDEVEELLTALPNGYLSFHDLSFQGVQVDHLVVGPGGIFLIETKGHAGTVMSAGTIILINGREPEQDFVDQTWSKTLHVRGILKDQTGRELPVIPLLCFTKASVRMSEAVKGMAVVEGSYLARHISWQKYLLSSEEVGQVVASLKAIAAGTDEGS